ncbi:phage tail assembly chaperone [Chromobacterium phragmitis]
MSPEVSYLWGWFCELSAGRQSSGYGPQPLSYGDIGAWERLLARRPRVWEVMLLKQLDLDYLEVQAMDDGALLAEQMQDDEARSRAIMALLVGG